MRKLRAGTMPPQGAPRPTQPRADAHARVARDARSIAPRRPSRIPGRPLLHRLNRAEYANAIRDLLALDVDVGVAAAARRCRPTASTTSPTCSASRRRCSSAIWRRPAEISALAVGDPATRPASDTYRVRQDLSQDRAHRRAAARHASAALLVRHTFPLDGEYTFQVKLFRTNLGIDPRPRVRRIELEITVDGERVHLRHDRRRRRPRGRRSRTPTDDRRRRSTRGCRCGVPVKAGPHEVGVAFLDEAGVRTPRGCSRSCAAPPDTGRLRPAVPHIDSRHDQRARSTPPARATRRAAAAIFACRPAQPRRTKTPCAQTDPRRRWRAAPTAGRSPTRDLRAAARASTRPAAREGTLRDRHPAGAAAHPGQPEVPVPRRARSGGRRAGRASIASATSSWRRGCRSSSGAAFPTTSCSTLAAQGRLQHAGGARAAGAADAGRSAAAGAGQQLRRPVAVPAQPAQHAARTPTSSRTSTTTCGRRSSARPSCSSTASCARTAASLDLLTADYTFVNERLARHYGIPNVYGSHFRRVTLTDEARRGLLGQGSILTVTSHADRTSPVLRGKWMLENLLGTPPPPPPADVPPLEENDEGGKPLTMRERMERAPRQPGLRQLPQADGSARLRARELRRGRRVADARTPATPIDASGELADGTKVDGVGDAAAGAAAATRTCSSAR